MLTAGFETPLMLTRHEVEQKEYEGCLVPDDIKDELKAMDADKDAFSGRLEEIQDRLAAIEPEANFPYVQPNELEAIRRERPEGPRQLPLNLTKSALLDRFHGAWTGRAAGCALGQPVEGVGVTFSRGEIIYHVSEGRKLVKHYLEARGDWPLEEYFSGLEAKSCDIKIHSPESWRENIKYMGPDDDIHYSLLGLMILEEKGLDFHWYDVAKAWNTSLPYSYICTAETQAILNYNMRTPLIKKDTEYTTPEFTRRHNNPYRELIGAQIRADGWAYCCAGNPELAAELAWRDAHWTHTANGIYGEMFVAAMIAAAFVESDPKRLVEIGLSEIPKNCKLAEAVREALVWIEECDNFESFMNRLEVKYSTMNVIHTVINALVVVMSLFYGGMNPDKSICIAVMAGLDTDCDGATVGSIVGAVSGNQNFGGKLQVPLNDKIKPLMLGFQEISMKELAERTLKVYQKITASL